MSVPQPLRGFESGALAAVDKALAQPYLCKI